MKLVIHGISHWSNNNIGKESISELESMVSIYKLTNSGINL
jgi:hypothetical protein